MAQSSALSEGNKGRLSPSLLIGPNQSHRGNMWGCYQSNGWAIYCYNSGFSKGIKTFMKFLIASATSVLSLFLQLTLYQLGASMACASCSCSRSCCSCCSCWGAQHRGATRTQCSSWGGPRDPVVMLHQVTAGAVH